MEKINIAIIGVLIVLVAVGAFILLLKEPPAEKKAGVDVLERGVKGIVYDIKMQDYAFIPSEITIKKGDTVKWTNYDNVGHSVLFEGYPRATSQVFSTGESYEYMFDEVGDFDYICGPHPRMTGKIIVQ